MTNENWTGFIPANPQVGGDPDRLPSARDIVDAANNTVSARDRAENLLPIMPMPSRALVESRATLPERRKFLQPAAAVSDEVFRSRR